MNKDVILLMSDHYDAVVESRYDQLLKNITGTNLELLLLINENEIGEVAVPSNIKVFRTTPERINCLGYEPIQETLIPGSCHFPILYFYKNNPLYHHYWLIEYDVFFNGNWKLLFENETILLSQADFVSCFIEKYNPNNADWTWWTLHNNSGFKLLSSSKSFNPICRFSNEALKLLDTYLKQGHSAHSEVMIVSCMASHNLKMLDMGGIGPFTPKELINKFYVQYPGINNGTMRWRPCYDRQEIDRMHLPDKLFHPLK